MIIRYFLKMMACAFAAGFLISPARAELPPIHSFALENGLEVIVIEDHRIPAVSHNLLFDYGAADDPRGKSGLAHYMEHMLFQGTETLEPNEYSRKVAAKGGKSNAFTSADYTGYWVNIAKEHLPLVMALEADRWENLQSTEDSFAREKAVILEERRARVDNNPAALFEEQMDAALYLHHPYGVPIIGWAQEMAALNQQDVMGYYRRYHQPGNALLVLSGDVTLKEAKTLVEQHYATIASRGASVPARVGEPPQRAPRRLMMHHPLVKEPQWGRAYVTPSYGWSPEAEASDRREAIIPLMIADYLLGGSKAGRLYQRLVEQEKLAQTIGSSFNPYRKGPGEFSLSLTPVDAAKIPQIEAMIEEEVQKLRDTPPSVAELKRAKTQLLASSIYLRDGLQPLAQAIGHLAMIGLPLNYYEEWEQAVEAVTAEQVSASLALLKPEYSVTGQLLPAK